MRDIVLKMLTLEFHETHADQAGKVVILYNWINKLKQLRTNKFI